MRYFSVLVSVLLALMTVGCQSTESDKLVVEGQIANFEDEPGSRYATMALEDGRKFFVHGFIPGRFGGEGVHMRFYMKESCENAFSTPRHCVEVDSTEVLEKPPADN
jgi:hypothetical protein